MGVTDALGPVLGPCPVPNIQKVYSESGPWRSQDVSSPFRGPSRLAVEFVSAQVDYRLKEVRAQYL
jgi:hypothetical protein